MGEESKVGMTERLRGFLRKKAIMPSDKVDKYIIGHLPELITEYKLALRRDLGGVDKKIEAFVAEMDEIKDWKATTGDRLKEARHKVDRLEKRYGIEEE